MPNAPDNGGASGNSRSSLLVHDSFLIGIMGVLAGCGLIYEYLLSHYAGRVLGAIESTIYTMIGLMIVSMGLGAFAAKLCRQPFTAFAWLEVCIAMLGVSCIIVIAALVSFTALLPAVIAETYLLPPDLLPQGGLFDVLSTIAHYSPFVFGTVIGFLIGMEIPLIARVREQIYGQHLEHNVGTIYGADYIGAGAGAAIWVLFMLSIDVTRAGVLTGLANVAAGIIFLIRYRNEICRPFALFVCHLIVVAMALALYAYGGDWTRRMSGLLYADEVVFDQSSHYQHLTVTRRHVPNTSEYVYGFYLNGRMQFSSEDEHIYHGMLVYPAMAIAPRRERVLIIGGGDGLALRDVLAWDPKQVDLIDLDNQLVDFFQGGEVADRESLPAYHRALVALNGASFSDPRVNVTFGDAFVEVDRLAKPAPYDVIIIDLPDPSHPDLNRLYSDQFYARLFHLLASEGVLVTQSTSPYHARNAFISIGQTLRAAGFPQVQQYRQNVPSFGEWGWSIATRQARPPRERLAELTTLPVAHDWLTRDLLLAAFEFPRDFFEVDVDVNTLGSHTVYRYHQDAWRRDMGIYQD